MLHPNQVKPIICRANEAQASPYDMTTDFILAHVKLQLAQLIANLVVFMGAISSPERCNLGTNRPLIFKRFSNCVAQHYTLECTLCVLNGS